MKKTISFLCLLLVSGTIFSQSLFRAKEYLYGRMVNDHDTLTGYFWFDNIITQNGQTVHYRENLETGKKKRFQSRRYDYFESDSLYLETFPTTGGVLIMIPRIVNGTIQLFSFRHVGGFMNSIELEHYFIKKGNRKSRIRKRDFKDQMEKIIGDDADLYVRIENEELKFDDLPQIILAYNASR